MVALQNSDDLGAGINSDGFSLTGGTTSARTLTLSGGNFPVLLTSPVANEILSFNGTNWIDTPLSANLTLSSGTLDLSTTGSAGTYGFVTTDSFGRVTSGITVAIGGGLEFTSGTVQISPTGVTSGTYQGLVINNLGQITSASDLVASGDVSGTASGTSLVLTLGTSGVTAGTYNQGAIVVNAKGLVTSITNINLNALSDVVITTPGTDQTIIYNGTNWINGSIPIGSPLTYTSGTINLGTSGVTAGTYDKGAIVIDGFGRVTNISNMAFDNLSDVNTTGESTGDNLVLVGGTWLPTQYQEATATGYSTTTATTYTSKLSFTTPTIPAGTYCIRWSYTWYYTNVSRNFNARILLNTGTIYSHIEAPVLTVATQRNAAAGFYYQTIASSGTALVELEFASSNTADTAGIGDTHLEFFRIG